MVSTCQISDKTLLARSSAGLAKLLLMGSVPSSGAPEAAFATLAFDRPSR
jgi:hypothetical protein